MQREAGTIDRAEERRAVKLRGGSRKTTYFILGRLSSAAADTDTHSEGLQTGTRSAELS